MSEVALPFSEIRSITLLLTYCNEYLARRSLTRHRQVANDRTESSSIMVPPANVCLLASDVDRSAWGRVFTKVTKQPKFILVFMHLHSKNAGGQQLETICAGIARGKWKELQIRAACIMSKIVLF